MIQVSRVINYNAFHVNSNSINSIIVVDTIVAEHTEIIKLFAITNQKKKSAGTNE